MDVLSRDDGLTDAAHVNICDNVVYHYTVPGNQCQFLTPSQSTLFGFELRAGLL